VVFCTFPTIKIDWQVNSVVFCTYFFHDYNWLV
jgi:hypothetical protein